MERHRRDGTFQLERPEYIPKIAAMRESGVTLDVSLAAIVYKTITLTKLTTPTETNDRFLKN